MSCHDKRFRLEMDCGPPDRTWGNWKALLNFDAHDAVMGLSDGNRARMNIWRAIIVHALAASLLVLGVCPSQGQSTGRTTADGKLLSGRNGVSQSAAAPAPQPSRCCSGMCGGKCCGMPCCRKSADRQSAPPATPDHERNENQQRQVATVCCDVPALLSEYDAVSLLRASSMAGGGSLAVITLQSQSVRIQT